MGASDLLVQLHRILKCKMALLIEDKLYFYPLGNVNSHESPDLEDYHAWEFEASGSKGIFYTEPNVRISESTLSLAILYIKSQTNANSFEIDSVVKLLSDQYNYSDVSVVNQMINKEKELFFIVLSASDMNGIEPELLEIIKNSAAVKHITKYQGNLIVLVEEQNIYEVCSDLQKNIFTELYVETVIAIGGRLEQPLQLGDLYRNCNEAMLLKQCYGVNLKVLDDQSMQLYKMIASIHKDQKACIVNKIFNSKFIELLNSEMELTIEEMFKNNLNLTDTSSRLYIHRNTLLYRIEKIHKLTGFDLRKFEDSMIFKLAWLMYKEKQI